MPRDTADPQAPPDDSEALQEDSEALRAALRCRRRRCPPDRRALC